MRLKTVHISNRTKYMYLLWSSAYSQTLLLTLFQWCEGIAIIFGFICRKFRAEGIQIRINLAAALFLAQVVFLSGINATINRVSVHLYHRAHLVLQSKQFWAHLIYTLQLLLNWFDKYRHLIKRRQKLKQLFCFQHDFHANQCLKIMHWWYAFLSFLACVCVSCGFASLLLPSIVRLDALRGSISLHHGGWGLC